MPTVQVSKNKKRLIFCTYSSVYSSFVLKEILKDENIDVVAIVNSSRILKSEYGALKGSIKQIRLSGWRYSTYLFFITDLFYWLQTVLTFRRPSLKTIHGIARQHEIPCINTKDINDKESLDFIRHYQADVLLAAHFNQLVKAEILNRANLQCINIHPSLLPAFKGVDPVFYALLNNQQLMGVSLHRMAESFDTGEVLLQAEQAITATDHCLFAINCKLFVKGAKLAVSWINKQSQDLQQPLSSTTLPTTLPTTLENNDQYDSWPGVEKINKFSRSGSKLMCLFDYFSTLFSGKLP